MTYKAPWCTQGALRHVCCLARTIGPLDPPSIYVSRSGSMAPWLPAKFLRPARPCPTVFVSCGRGRWSRRPEWRVVCTLRAAHRPWRTGPTDLNCAAYGLCLMVRDMRYMGRRPCLAGRRSRSASPHGTAPSSRKQAMPASTTTPVWRTADRRRPRLATCPHKPYATELVPRPVSFMQPESHGLCHIMLTGRCARPWPHVSRRIGCFDRMFSHAFHHIFLYKRSNRRRRLRASRARWVS